MMNYRQISSDEIRSFDVNFEVPWYRSFTVRLTSATVIVLTAGVAAYLDWI